MGITVYWEDALVTADQQLMILVTYGLVAFAIVVLLVRKKRVSDR